MSTDPILKVSDLNLDLRKDGVYVPLLQNISFEIEKGEVLALVGESGCGKSVCSVALTRLLPSGLFRFSGGEVVFEGKNLLKINAEELRNIRGSRISYVFQEPFSALNPLQKIKDQMSESFLVHGLGTRKQAEEKAEYLLSAVGITDVKMRMNCYPHQLSGGILQRVGIGMSLMCDPKLLIADEPTSALDVTVQAQLLELLLKLKREFDLSVLFISHDFGLVSHIADRICVLYAGRIAEIGTVDQVLDVPRHPYTKDLLDSLPSRFSRTGEFRPIEGRVPTPGNYPKGCHYANRCRSAFSNCELSKPNLKSSHAPEHLSACFLDESEEVPA
ncbi:ABC transporter ATP-binding protein [Leptospira wolffii]|uniref:ABC transporter ATP-binding protein n=1 Tax=Leptospira wolffii TaxID=409998 RepID=UPI0010842A87|nr:ABC transporter ATP-binding protein [Leptospira wolffii]TGK61758.1 ABC transporter ATP-binding protein [Leptospira wolffii]TGK70301.1 ABC transporter ATP-binding protein [Leptospira wolffii]TGK74954.1 ABC transporter ATP-binding protein [Leptospira wolffii]TGL30923.1 ABC transporter ATP-binding protein [Leptospira wolffii]